MSIEICDVTKVFGTFIAFDNVSLHLVLTESNEPICLQLPQDRYPEFALRHGVQVSVASRRIQLFLDDAGGRAALQAAREYALQEERLLSPTGP